MTLGSRTLAALAVVLHSKNLTAVLHACEALEVTTRFSAVCCARFREEGAAPILFALIKSCNRSKPHQELLKVAMDVLEHVASAPAGAPAVTGAVEAVEVLLDVMQVRRAAKLRRACIPMWTNADVPRRARAAAPGLAPHDGRQRGAIAARGAPPRGGGEGGLCVNLGTPAIQQEMRASGDAKKRISGLFAVTARKAQLEARTRARVGAGAGRATADAVDVCVKMLQELMARVC